MPLLEATAVIRAKDETGPVFAKIEARIAELSKSVAAVGKASASTPGAIRNTEALASQVAASTRETEALAGTMARVNGHVSRTHKEVRGLSASLREAGQSMAPLVGLGVAFAGYEVASHVVKANFDRQHERVRMEASGMKPGEIADAEAASSELAAKYAPVSQTDIMHMLRNTRSIVGSYAEARQITDPLLALRVVAMGAHPGEEMEADFDKLVKGLEIKGVTQDPAKFKAYIDAMGKAVNAFGDTLRPTDFYEMFKYGRQATQNLSLDYMASVAPKLAQELGGASAGQAQSAFFNAIVGGHMTKTALKRLSDFGLVDQSKVVSPKGGGLANAAGAIRGSALAAINPYEWVNQILLPAMAKKGVIDPEKIQEVIGSMFSKSTAAQLVSILATQQEIIDKDRRIIQGTESTAEAADHFMHDDPNVAAKSVSNALENLAVELVGGGANAAHAMSGFAESINRFVADVDKERRREDYLNKHGYPDEPVALDSIRHGDDAAADRAEALRKQIDLLDPASAPAKLAALGAEAAKLQAAIDAQRKANVAGPDYVKQLDRLDAINAEIKTLQGGDEARKAAQEELKSLDASSVDAMTLFNRKTWSDRDLAAAKAAQMNAPGSWRSDKKGGGFVFPDDYQGPGAPYLPHSLRSSLSFGAPSFAEHPYGLPGVNDPIEPVELKVTQQRINEMSREPAGGHAMGNAPVDVDVKGSATIEAKFLVEASSALLNIVKMAENIAKEIPLVGTSRAGIAPNGQGRHRSQVGSD